jgi:TM2 domain-containing membrane protein YozV
MKKFLLLFIIFTSVSFSQENMQTDSLDIYSPQNIKKFADHLFCSDDYLRAIGEYQRYLSTNKSDTVEFKIGLAYSRMEDFQKAAGQFNSIKSSSPFYEEAEIDYYKSIFQMKNYSMFRKSLNGLNIDSPKFTALRKLNNFSYFFTDDPLPPENDFLQPFRDDEIPKIKEFYKFKEDPPYKSPLAGAIMSAAIPGAGKFYADQIGDGIFAFLTTTVLAYLSYDNFNARHYLRAWIFTGLAAGFYGGNIYGSAAAVQIYNAKISFDFENGLKVFLDKENYFTKIYDFCK